MKFDYHATCVNLLEDAALFAVEVFYDRTKVGDLSVLVNDKGQWSCDGYMDENLTSFDSNDAVEKAGELCCIKAQIAFNTSKRQQHVNFEEDCQ